MQSLRTFIRVASFIAASLAAGFGTGQSTSAEVLELPRVLTIGDSIMQGYFSATQAELAGQFTLFQPSPGSGQTDDAVGLMDTWLAAGPWDVIHFNWGLHDLYTQNVNHPGVNAVPIDRYEANLRVLVPKLVASGAELVWCSTTPGVDPAFPVEDVLAYNAVAAEVMGEYGIPIDDLHALMLPVQEQYQRSPGDIHYNAAGSALMAEQVAASILSVHDGGTVPSTGVILSHDADLDPTTEGWALFSQAGGSGGPVLNDQGPGLHAWSTIDASTDGGGYSYRGESRISPEAKASIAEDGFSMRATLRVDDFAVSGFDEAFGQAPGIQIALEDPGLWILFKLGTDTNGDTVMRVEGGYDSNSAKWTTPETRTITGSGYNEYELLWNPEDGLDVLVNDELLVDNWDAATNPEWAAILGDRLYWGCSDGPGIGAGYWSKVEFEILGGATLPGDLNGDGIVGSSDLDIVRSFWGQTVEQGSLSEGDPSGDGLVSADDLDIVRGNWGASSPASVPEPSALVLLAVVLVGFVARRR